MLPPKLSGRHPRIGAREARLREGNSAAGRGPGEQRKQAKARAEHEASNTLEIVARDWLKHMSAQWAPITMQRISASLEADIFPQLGKRPMANIKPKELGDAVQKVEKRGAADQAGWIMQRVKAIYRYAVTHDCIDTNRMVDLMPAEVLKPRQVQHRPALSDRELPEFLSRVAVYEGDAHTINALRLLMLTSTRLGEIRGAG